MLVSWNAPEGGFFIVLEVPFVADASALERCAADHEVLWTPMQDFYLADGGARQLRLSCSAIEPAEIPAGVDRLARFITAETARAAASASG